MLVRKPSWTPPSAPAPDRYSQPTEVPQHYSVKNAQRSLGARALSGNPGTNRTGGVPLRDELQEDLVGAARLP
jgi:hypothetical protein